MYLKYLDINVEKIMLFAPVMRGGVSYIFKRYRKGNNKCLTSHNRKKPTKYITYLDKNNLCGYDMLKSFATGGFQWLDPAKCNLNMTMSMKMTV